MWKRSAKSWWLWRWIEPCSISQHVQVKNGFSTIAGKNAQVECAIDVGSDRLHMPIGKGVNHNTHGMVAARTELTIQAATEARTGHVKERRIVATGSGHFDG